MWAYIFRRIGRLSSVYAYALEGPFPKLHAPALLKLLCQHGDPAALQPGWHAPVIIFATAVLCPHTLTLCCCCSLLSWLSVLPPPTVWLNRKA